MEGIRFIWIILIKICLEESIKKLISLLKIKKLIMLIYMEIKKLKYDQ